MIDAEIKLPTNGRIMYRYVVCRGYGEYLDFGEGILTGTVFNFKYKCVCGAREIVCYKYI